MDAKGSCRATRRSRASCARPGGPVLLAVNKTDDKRAQAAALEFYQLGFEPVFEISAEHGTGVGDLLDEIVERLGGARPRRSETRGVERRRGRRRSASAEPRSRDETAVAIVGRPNVGQVVAASIGLLQEERVLVSDMPGTTRDAIDAALTWHRRRFRIVDTAGMRRPGRVPERRARSSWSASPARRRRSPTPTSSRCVIDASDRRHRSGRGDRRGSRPRRPRHRHRRQQVGPGEERRTRSSSRRSTTSCGKGCGFSTTRRSCTSRR